MPVIGALKVCVYIPLDFFLSCLILSTIFCEYFLIIPFFICDGYHAVFYLNGRISFKKISLPIILARQGVVKAGPVLSSIYNI